MWVQWEAGSLAPLPFSCVSLGNPFHPLGFPGGLAGEESACNAGDLGSIPGLGRSPGGGHGNPLQCSCLENPHRQKSLAGYSPWGHKELDMTEKLSKAQRTLYTKATIFGNKNGIVHFLRELIVYEGLQASN